MKYINILLVAPEGLFYQLMSILYNGQICKYKPPDVFGFC